MLFTFLTIVTYWSRSTSNFYALIDQNLTGEFVQKIDTAFWNLFTFTAEADRVFLVNLWCFYLSFSTGCIKWNTAAIRQSVIHGWFVYWIFGWEMRRLSKSEIRFRMASFSFFTLLDAGWKVSSDSGLTWSLSGAASWMVRLSIYCICVFVCFFIYIYLISWSRAQF